MRYLSLAFLFVVLSGSAMAQNHDEWIFQTQDFASLKKMFENNPGLLNWIYSYKQTHLHIAAKGKKLELARYLLSKGADPNLIDAYACTPLAYAAANNDIEMMRLLIDHKANINLEKGNVLPPLIHAINNGHPEAVRFLLEKGAAPNPPDNDGASRLGAAAVNGQAQIAEILIKSGAQIQNREENPLRRALYSSDCKTIIVFAQLSKDKKLFLPFLERNQEQMAAVLSQPLSQDRYGSTALHWLVLFGDPKSIPPLVANCQKKELGDNWSRTPFLLACASDKVEFLDPLFSDKIDIYKKDQRGYTAMDYAVKHNNIPMVDFLLSKGFKKDSLLWSQFNLMTLVAYWGHIDLMKHLETKGFSIHDTDPLGRGTLVGAGFGNKAKMVLYLLDKGVKLKNPQYKEENLIHDFISGNNPEMVKTLVLRGMKFSENNMSNVVFCFQKETLDFFLNHPDINANAGGWRRSPLSFAVEYGSFPQVQKLSAETANWCDTKKGSPDIMETAIQYADLETIRFLVAHKCAVKHPEYFGSAWLKLALKRGDAEVADFVLKGVKANEKVDQAGLLLEAINSDSPDVVKMLIENGCNANAVDSAGRTPLFYVTKHDSPKILELLLTNKGDLNVRDKAQMTPLLFAIQNGHASMVKTLIDKGANLKIEDYYGRTPMSLAVSTNKDVIRTLIDSGCDVNSADENGFTPLHLAAMAKNPETLQALLEKGAKPNTLSQNGDSPLLYAIMGGDDKCVSLLVKAGADVNVKCGGTNSLLYAASNFRTSLFDILLENGAKIDEVDDLGNTLLHHTVALRDSRYAVKLIERKAALNVQNKKGETPLLIALSSSVQDAIIIRLINAGANVDLKNKEGFTPLHYAVNKRRPELTKMIAMKTGNIDAKNNKGLTPLIIAVQQGDWYIARMLVESEANVNIMDANGHTAYYYAKLNNYLGLVEYLKAHNATTEGQEPPQKKSGSPLR